VISMRIVGIRKRTNQKRQGDDLTPFLCCSDDDRGHCDRENTRTHPTAFTLNLAPTNTHRPAAFTRSGRWKYFHTPFNLEIR
jgi:hypothetical protein